MDSPHATGNGDTGAHQEDELDFGEDDLYVAPPPAATAATAAHEASKADDQMRDDDESDVVSLPGSPRVTSREVDPPAATDSRQASLSAQHSRQTSPHSTGPRATDSHSRAASPAPPTPPPAKRAHDPKEDANGNLLPPGWTSRVSSQNDVYYKEEATGKSTWDIPEWPAPQRERERTRSPAPKKVDRVEDKPAGRLAVHPDRLKLVPLLPTESKGLVDDTRKSESLVPVRTWPSRLDSRLFVASIRLLTWPLLSTALSPLFLSPTSPRSLSLNPAGATGADDGRLGPQRHDDVRSSSTG